MAPFTSIVNEAHEAFSENTAVSQTHFYWGFLSVCFSDFLLSPADTVHYCGIQRSSGRTFFLNLRNVDTAPAMAETVCLCSLIHTVQAFIKPQ